MQPVTSTVSGRYFYQLRQLRCVIVAETMQRYVHYGFVGDVETVFVQSDARVARPGFTEQCNSSGAIQISHFHSLIACRRRRRRPVHPLLCVKKQRKV